MTRNFFVHPSGICESETVGENTRVWAFAHVLPGARIGRNCNICDNVFIENDVIVGDDVTLKCGVQLWDGVRLEDGVFIGPNATFTNDKFPRSRQYPETFHTTTIETGASIGANATILPGVRVGRYAMVGAGAVVTKDVPPNAVVVGNPAVIVGYQSASLPHAELGAPSAPQQPGAKVALGVGECTLWRLPKFADLRGDLAPLEFTRDLPFVPLRSFLVYGVPTAKVRGEHAHHHCHQFLIAAHGSLSVVVDDGQSRVEVELTDPSIGLHIPPRIWGVQYKFQPDTVLMVMASHGYDANEYFRDYSTFLETVNAR